VAPVVKSWTNTSVSAFSSLATRFVARLSNATIRPSAEIAGAVLSSLPETPALSTLACRTAPLASVFTYTSGRVLASPAASASNVTNATALPSALIRGALEVVVVWVPSGAALMSRTSPVVVSATNTSSRAFTSPATRSAALLTKATSRPSRLSDGDDAPPPVPGAVRLATWTVPRRRSRTTTSADPMVSPAPTGSVVTNATKRPLPEIAACVAPAGNSAPNASTPTRVVEGAAAAGCRVCRPRSHASSEVHGGHSTGASRRGQGEVPR
jgi:hypothetical protein